MTEAYGRKKLVTEDFAKEVADLIMVSKALYLFGLSLP